MQKKKKVRRKPKCPDCKVELFVQWNDCPYCGGVDYFECPECGKAFDLEGEEL